MSTQDLEQYQRAISALHSQELDQTLEDQIDAEMARLNEEDFSDAAMEEAVFPQLVSARAEAEQVHVLPSEFTEFAQRIPVGGEITRFSFEGRRYLKQPYDTSANRILLKFSRQSEKSLVEHSMVLLADGSETPISEVRVGDWVVTMLPDGAHTSVSRVTWKSERYRKPCVRIRTQRCLSADAAVTHPFRRWGRWTPAGELKIGDRVATVRRAGLFTSEAPALADNHIKFVAYMIGDGCCGCSNNFSFTQQPGLVLDDFLTIAHQEQWPVRIADKSGTRAKQVHVGKITTARTWLKEGGLWLCRSADKALPAWVWDLPRTQAALFLNRLWSTDGSVLLHGHQYEIVYSSISRTLVRGVQRLLWKFGIPSRIRELHPQVYRGSNKCAYILAVQTQPGIVQFLTEVGALGKSEDIPLPSMAPNNNQDTFPVEITQDLHAVNASGGSGGRGRNATYSLSSAGLTATPSYPPSRRRLQEYVDFFRGHPRYDQNLVDQLAAHLDTDLYWDRVIGVEDIGEQWCYDIAIEEDESFVTDGKTFNGYVSQTDPASVSYAAAPTLAADQLTRLADEVSDLRNAVSQLVAGARQRGDQISDLQRRVGELEVQGRTRPAGVPSGFAPPPPGEGPVQAPSLTTKTAEELYQVGMAKFQAKDFDAAVLLFYELIVTYPSHALRESAQFLVAEIFYAQKDYRGALAEFQALVRDVPRGRKVPDALVKIGLTQRELGERDTAQRTWERVLRDYPTSVAARQARVLLRR